MLCRDHVIAFEEKSDWRISQIPREVWGSCGWVDIASIHRESSRSWMKPEAGSNQISKIWSSWSGVRTAEATAEPVGKMGLTLVPHARLLPLPPLASQNIKSSSSLLWFWSLVKYVPLNSHMPLGKDLSFLGLGFLTSWKWCPAQQKKWRHED